MHSLTAFDLIESTQLAEIAGHRHRDLVRDVILPNIEALNRIGPELREIRRAAPGLKGGRPSICYAMSRAQCLYVVSCMKNSERSKAIKEKVATMVGLGGELIEALSAMELPDDLPDMYVYAIRESETGRIKLGISRDPEARLRQLQTGNSQALELVAYRKAENRYQDESEAHRLFSNHRVRGEWFDPISKNTASASLHNWVGVHEDLPNAVEGDGARVLCTNGSDVFMEDGHLVLFGFLTGDITHWSHVTPPQDHARNSVPMIGQVKRIDK